MMLKGLINNFQREVLCTKNLKKTNILNKNVIRSEVIVMHYEQLFFQE